MGRMVTTPELGLIAWNLSTDPYNSGQLAENFYRIDQHDHTSGKGKRIGTGAIKDGAITQAKFAPGVSLPSSSISPGQVGTTELADNAVTSIKILDGTVTGTDIAPSTVASSNIVNGTIAPDDVTPAFLTTVGVSSSGVVRRGKAIIATEEVKTTGAAGLLTTPDQVSNIVLPTDGVLWISCSGMVKASSPNTGQSVEIQINGVLLQRQDNVTNTGIAIIDNTFGSNVYGYYYSDAVGGMSAAPNPSTPATTGQVLGAFFPVLAAAGTYTVTMKPHTINGTMTLKLRKLYVKAEAF